MKHILIGLLSVLATQNGSFAQESGLQSITDTDLSGYQVFNDDEDVVSLKDLEQLEASARTKFDAQDCEAALPEIIDFSEDANRLSNIIRQGIEPFYSASRDDQEVIGRNAKFDDMISAEATANKLLEKRNEFWVMEAECLFANGDKIGAVNRLYRALEYIDGRKETALWERARTQLWNAVGFVVSP